MAIAVIDHYYFHSSNSLEQSKNNNNNNRFWARNKGKNARELIISIVDQCPGIRFRKLLRLTGLSDGSLSYHVKVLEAQGKLKVSRTNRVTHFYSVKLDDFMCSIASEIAQCTPFQIIALLTNCSPCSLGGIADEIHKARSTVCWHLQRMHRKGLVLKTRNHASHSVSYSLCRRDIVNSLLYGCDA